MAWSVNLSILSGHNVRARSRESLTGCVGCLEHVLQNTVRGEMVARHLGRYLAWIFEDASMYNLRSLWCN